MLKVVSKKVGFVAAIAGAAIIGGATTAFVSAAIPSSADGKIHACYKNNASLVDTKGALRVIDNQANQNCNSNETAVDWQASGGSTSEVAYTRISVDSNDQAVLDPQRTKNITSATYVEAENGVEGLQGGYCITVGFLPKNLQITLAQPFNGFESHGWSALKDSEGIWNVDTTLRFSPEQICASAPSANAFVGDDYDLGTKPDMYIRFDN